MLLMLRRVLPASQIFHASPLPASLGTNFLSPADHAHTQTFDEAAKLINQHEYGDGTAIFTRDRDAARELALEHRGWHGGRQRANPVPFAVHSFGGWKR